MLSQLQIKNKILNYFSTNPGSTDVQLTTSIFSNVDDFALDIPTLLEKYVNDGELIAIIYRAPNQYSNTLFFPKTTKISVEKLNGHLYIKASDIDNIIVPNGTKIKIYKLNS